MDGKPFIAGFHMFVGLEWAYQGLSRLIRAYQVNYKRDFNLTLFWWDEKKWNMCIHDLKSAIIWELILKNSVIPKNL